MIKIFKATTVNQEILESVNFLLPQLSQSAKSIQIDQLNDIINSECTSLIFAKDEEKIIGMLSFVVYQIPTGKKAWVEDVVVHKSARGKGVGKLLMNFALEIADQVDAKSIDLTSRPSRETANKLYQSMGYEIRETNVYRYGLN